MKNQKTPVSRSKVDVGDRVGAVSHTDGNRLFLFGYGSYVGERRPGDFKKEERPVGDIGALLAETNSPHPLIRLDDGSFVWACECWWGPEDDVKTNADRYEVETISIQDRRTASPAQPS